MTRRAALLLLVLCAGCAKKPAMLAPPPAPAPAHGGHPSSAVPAVEEREASPSSLDDADAPHAGESPQDETASPLVRAWSELEQAALELDAADGDCGLACRARDSMRRAASRICELNGAGDPGDRCARARREVSRADERVARRCGECRE